MVLHLTNESDSDIAQSCPTLCNPMDCSLPGSSIHGIFQARVLEWAAISFSRGSSRPRDRSCIADRRFTVWAMRCLNKCPNSFGKTGGLKSITGSMFHVGNLRQISNSSLITESANMGVCGGGRVLSGREVCGVWLEFKSSLEAPQLITISREPKHSTALPSTVQ